MRSNSTVPPSNINLEGSSEIKAEEEEEEEVQVTTQTQTRTWVALWNCFFNPATDITSVAVEKKTKRANKTLKIYINMNETERGSGKWR